MAMRSLGYMPSEVELAIIMQRLDMDGESVILILSIDFLLSGIGITKRCKETKQRLCCVKLYFYR